MTRLLYDKHVPADDLLAPLFANMPPEQPQLEAALLAQAFGAPAPEPPAASAPEPPAAPVPVRPAFTEPQRARWVALALRAADEAVLPADPGFRAALASYLEWASRTAGAPPQWDWGPRRAARRAARAGQRQHRRRPGARARRTGELRHAHQAPVPRT